MFDYRDVLDSDGLIARGRQGYERRDAQLAMAAEVDAAIREQRHLAVEAGTGVGKSFAYLAPAILYVVDDQVRAYANGENESDSDDPSASGSLEREISYAGGLDDEAPVQLRRVIVSTHTISLQEQLFEKDIPFLNSILPFEFTAALAKGRSNYVCLRRFRNAAKGASTGTLFETDQQKEFERLKEWLNTCKEGSKSELNPVPTTEVWNEICCEQGNCLGRQCPWREDCFYARARKRLENAQLIVVNHALLFSDVALRGAGAGGSILPNYDVLIFDEAHTMEQVAAEHMGIELTQYSLDYLLSRLYNDRTNKGLLVEENARFPKEDEENDFVLAANKVDECRVRASEFFENLSDWLEERPGSNGRVYDKEIVTNGLSEGLASLETLLRKAGETLEDPGRRAEYSAAASRVQAYQTEIDDWLLQRKEGFVYWLERSGGRRPRLEMHAAPIDVAPMLRATLFNQIPTVIAASATLTTSRQSQGGAGLRRKKKSAEAPKPVEIGAVAKDPDEESDETRSAFQFFRSRVGMTGARARALGSPFNYREQMTLVLAKGLELENPSDKDENERRLFMALQDYVDETDGGAFVLFTNAGQMRRATESLGSWFAEKNYPFFSQAEGLSRRLMLQKFKESMRSVLFGVDSFWQGVDVPGAALRNVIIVRLPFLAPEQPLVQARCELIEQRGGSAFNEYQLPTAILKFKQGVGRLVRTRTDVGQVVLLDERVHKKSYGRDFLQALPDCKFRLDVFQ